MDIAAEAPKTGRKSTILSWLAVVALGSIIFGLLYGASALLREYGGPWIDRWNSWSITWTAVCEVVALALIIFLAALLTHRLERERVERRALILGSWVLYMPALLSGLWAAAGISYLMWGAMFAGGVVSAFAWLLVVDKPTAASDWREWIAVGRVGPGAAERAESGDWHVFALLIVAVGIAITMLGFIQVLRAHREKRLQTDGLYATVRHPQHLGIAIWTFGLAFAASTTAAYLTWFTVLFFYVLLALWEEKRLTLQFGEAYIGYRQGTPFMVPFLKVGLPCPSLAGGDWLVLQRTTSSESPPFVSSWS